MLYVNCTSLKKKSVGKGILDKDEDIREGRKLTC